MNHLATAKDPFKVFINQAEFREEPIDANINLLSAVLQAVSFDIVIQTCGHLGRFQLTHYFLMNLISMSAAVVGFYYVFAAANIDHRCRLPDNVWPNDNQYHPINKTHELLINRYIPKTNDGRKWEQCVRYLHGTTNDTFTNCPNGWAYDRSVFGYTFTEEANFVCGSSSKRSLIATLMQCGGF
ncbi:unnamed protein product, partial [Rotaria magnacalcarata]